MSDTLQKSTLPRPEQSTLSVTGKNAVNHQVLKFAKTSNAKIKRRAKSSQAEIKAQLADGYRLAELDVSIHYLKENSKIPVELGWSRAPNNTPGDLIRKYRSTFNLGVRLGAPSKVGNLYLHCIDVDIRGSRYLAEAKQKLRELIPNLESLPCVQSGSGGESRHYYFFTTVPFTSKKLARSHEQIKGEDGKMHFAWEIELFGTGKQTVLPPSVHPITRKQYKWLRRFNFEAIMQGQFPEVAAAVIQNWFMPEGSNTEQNTSARLPRERSASEIDKILRLLERQKWCEDRDGWLKLGMALHHQFRGSEEGYDIWCAYSQQSDKYDEIDQRRVWESFKQGENLFTFASLAYETHDTSIQAEFAKISDEIKGAVQKSTSNSTLMFYEPGQNNLVPEPRDFVEGVLFNNQMSVIVGPPGSGKTFVLLDLAAHVALGLNWQGCAVDQLPVLYIALEGSSGMKRRLQAWCKHHDNRTPHALPIHFADGSLNIREDAATRKKIIEYALTHGIKWIIIDTLSRAMAGGDENGAGDMGGAFLGADEIRRLSGAHVSIVHHTGKDQSKGGRGSSLLLGNIDTEIQISRDGVKRSARLTKQKEGEDGTQWQFKLETVQLGYQDQRGKPVSSAVAMVGNGVDFDPINNLSEREKALFDILSGLMAESKIADASGAAIVPVGVLQASLSEHKWPSSPCTRSARSNALSRAMEGLIEADKILKSNGNITLYI